MGESMKTWICPECGQWGKDYFGDHRLPDASIFDKTVCRTPSVLVEMGPLWRRALKVAREAE